VFVRWRSSCILILLIAVCAVESACAVGMNKQIFRNGIFRGLPNLDQSTVKFNNGELRGLTDAKGQQILPTIYADISYCGHGIFLATEVDPEHRWYFSRKRHLFNRNGLELPVMLPQDAVLLNIFSFGPKADSDPELVLNELDSSTILLFGLPEDKEGLCDVRGTTTLPALSAEIRFVSSNSAYVKMPNVRYVVDLKTGEESPTGTCGYSAGIFPVPRIPRSSLTRTLPLPHDRQITMIPHDDGSFDKEYWLERRPFPISRLVMFNRFLKDHDLIGMPEADLIGNIGPKRSRDKKTFEYALPELGRGMPPCDTGMRMYLKDGRVERWCFFSKVQESDPITTNVVLEDPANFRLRLFHNGIYQGIFPKTNPKTEVR